MAEQQEVDPVNFAALALATTTPTDRALAGWCLKAGDFASFAERIEAAARDQVTRHQAQTGWLPVERTLLAYLQGALHGSRQV